MPNLTPVFSSIVSFYSLSSNDRAVPVVILFHQLHGGVVLVAASFQRCQSAGKNLTAQSTSLRTDALWQRCGSGLRRDPQRQQLVECSTFTPVNIKLDGQLRRVITAVEERTLLFVVVVVRLETVVILHTKIEELILGVVVIVVVSVQGR